MKYLKKAWGLLDGIKTYLGGGGMMLSGAAMVAGDAAEFIESLQTMEPSAMISPAIEFFSKLPTSPGAVTFCAGLVAVGLGHKGDKAKVAAEKATAITVVNNAPQTGKTKAKKKP